MFWFNYEFKNFSEIIENFLKITSYSLLEFFILFIWITFIFTNIFVITPMIKNFFKKRLEEKEKNKKRQMINKIVIQKNLEDLIMREINEKK